MSAKPLSAIHPAAGPGATEDNAPSANAVEHGFTASSFTVVRLEELKEVAKLKADAVACYRPRNAQELFAVERIALAQQQMLRGARLEAGLFTAALNESLDPLSGHPVQPMSLDMVGGDIEITRAQNRNYALGEGFSRMVSRSDAWVLLLRYQTRAEREYRRAIEDLERLKAMRNEMPDEAGVGIEIPVPEDIAPIQELNDLLDPRQNRKEPINPKNRLDAPLALSPVRIPAESRGAQPRGPEKPRLTPPDEGA